MLNRIWRQRMPIEANTAVEQAESVLPALPSGLTLPFSKARLSAIGAAILSALPISAALLAALVVNLPTLDDYFHGDDFVAFTELGTKQPLQYLYDTFTFKDVNFYWRPLGQASYLALYHAFGLDPAAFHALSIAMFLFTLWLIYRFSVNIGLSRVTAAAAAAIFALLPSHVVSVAWVTNSPRIMAVMFFMASLVVLQKALAKRSWQLDIAAWLLFLAAALSDETSLALAPVPVLYAAIHSGRLVIDRAVIARCIFYAALVASLAPLQFMFTLDDEPRLADYAFGPHILEQTWALTSQLVLPLAEGSPLALSFRAIGPEQWAAGAVAIAAGVLLLVSGSWLLRLLAVWTAIALAPFTLWDIEWLSPRYVYMAALPYSILLAWGAAAMLQVLQRWRPAELAAAACVLVIALTAGAAGADTTIKRNQEWARSTEPFRILAEGMPAAVPELPPNARVLIYYGIWQDFPLWPRVVLRTVYRDESIDVISIDRRNVDTSFPRREARDVVVYYSGGRFLLVPPSVPRP